MYLLLKSIGLRYELERQSVETFSNISGLKGLLLKESVAVCGFASVSFSFL